MSAPDRLEATFDEHQHADRPGWATYHEQRPVPWWRRRRRHDHSGPAVAPEPADGHSPSNYTQCASCGEPGHWYVVGQHRYGGIDRDPRYRALDVHCDCGPS